MKRKWPAIGFSITAVILLTLTSLSNVVGYQAVQTSQQNLIEERINQRELLFQTIVDIANNKEIQRIILKSQMSRGIFPASEIPVVTKNQLKMMYFIGLILSKVIITSRIQSMVQQYQLMNPEIQKEISTVIEKDMTLNTAITQLKNSECDCGKNINGDELSFVDSADYPIFKCLFLFAIMITIIVIWSPVYVIGSIFYIMDLKLIWLFTYLIFLPFLFPFIVLFLYILTLAERLGC